jgi:hypothetical protein
VNHQRDGECIRFRSCRLKPQPGHKRCRNEILGQRPPTQGGQTVSQIAMGGGGRDQEGLLSLFAFV